MPKPYLTAYVEPSLLEELRTLKLEAFPEVSFSQMIEKLLERVLNDYFRESSQRKE